jgi:hypothetical protein
MVGFCLVFRCNIKQKSTISYFNEVRMADINSVIVNLVMYNDNPVSIGDICGKTVVVFTVSGYTYLMRQLLTVFKGF